MQDQACTNKQRKQIQKLLQIYYCLFFKPKWRQTVLPHIHEICMWWSVTYKTTLYSFVYFGS